MRRQDRAISTEEAIEILEKESVGVLSTVDQEGQPYGVPVNYIYDRGHIYFHCRIEGHKLDNIYRNSQVCFTVYAESEILPEQFSTRYSSVIVFGKAEIVEEEEKVQALRTIVEKLSPGFEKEGYAYIERGKDQTKVVKIKINKLTGKRRK